MLRRALPKLRPSLLSFPALSALKFSPQEKAATRLNAEKATDAPPEGKGKGLGPRRILALVERFYQTRVLTEAVTERVPRMHERVCMENRNEVFVVIYVDKKRVWRTW